MQKTLLFLTYLTVISATNELLLLRNVARYRSILATSKFDWRGTTTKFVPQHLSILATNLLAIPNPKARGIGNSSRSGGHHEGRNVGPSDAHHVGRIFPISQGRRPVGFPFPEFSIGDQTNQNLQSFYALILWFDWILCEKAKCQSTICFRKMFFSE